MNVSDGPQIEMNIQYIQDNFTSVYGTPYKIVRIPMVPSILEVIQMVTGAAPPIEHMQTIWL